jgi:B12-binding domain/radical SAM domain protein of rhizo-twelve system
MKYALVNPPWTFHGSIYFGCREPHLPLEFGYARALLEGAGHDVLHVDAGLEGLDRDAVRRRVEAFAPEITVIPTAPSYLFWRCAPPELRVPRQAVRDLWPVSKAVVVVGPHGSTTPHAVMEKLEADALVLGECEEVLPKLASEPWSEIPALCTRGPDGIRCRGGPHTSDLSTLPALRWDRRLIARHSHHHHRFDRTPRGPGAELESSRGCPYACSFCAKETFRGRFRRRPLAVVLDELDGLLAAGVEYVYFIDELFIPDRLLLEALAARPFKFGIQTRIDLWSFEMIDLLARAGCVSIETGVESITPEGRDALNKQCRLTTPELTARLTHAKRAGVSFVQATLARLKADDPDRVEAWRREVQKAGIWANQPVPFFPYPGSPEYARRWGPPDGRAWERAHAHYLNLFDCFSDVQDARPLPLRVLDEDGGHPGRPPRRILMTADAIGGVWTFALDLARALSARGIRIDLAVFGPPASEAQQRDAARIPDLTVHQRPSRLEWMDGPWEDIRQAGRWLLDLASRLAPDLIHLNSYALAALDWRIPVIVTGHSCVLSWWQAVHGAPAPAAWDRYRLEVARGVQAASAVAAPTRAMLQALESLYGPSRRRAVIMNGRDASGFHEAPKADLLLGVGRFWDAAKNLEALDRAAEGLPWRTVLAGDLAGPGGREALPRHATPLGRLPAAELAPWYARAALLVHPARYEPFGLAPLEAALSGCALVLGDIPSLREVWADCALYVPPDEPKALREAIRALIDHPEQRHALAAKARSRGRRFTAARMAAGYLDLYSDAQRDAHPAQEVTPFAS